MKKQLLILLCLPLIGFGQEWTYGGSYGDRSSTVQQTTDGGYIISGTTNSFGNGDWNVYLIKTDGSGNELWNKTFGGTSLDFGLYVQQTTDGGYIVTGLTNSSTCFGNGDVLLIKTDVNGDLLWTKTFEANIGNSVKQTTDGGYIICGSTDYVGNGGSDVYLIKTNINGDSLWTKTFGGTGGDSGTSVQQTTDGGYIITGFTDYDNCGSYSNVYLIKTDANGNSLWTKTFGGTGGDSGTSVKQTSDGGYIITGSTESFGNGNGYPDIYLIKTDVSGNELWYKTFGGTGGDYGGCVQQTTDGGYIISGITNLIDLEGSDLYLIKTDGNGDTLWTKSYGGTGLEFGGFVQQTSDGGYVICGYTNSFGNGDSDVYLIKTDGNGNVTSTFNIPLNSNRKLEKIVDILGKETKPQTNTPLIEIYDDGSTEKKIIIE